AFIYLNLGCRAGLPAEQLRSLAARRPDLSSIEHWVAEVGRVLDVQAFPMRSERVPVRIDRCFPRKLDQAHGITAELAGESRTGAGGGVFAADTFHTSCAPCTQTQLPWMSLTPTSTIAV